MAEENTLRYDRRGYTRGRTQQTTRVRIMLTNYKKNAPHPLWLTVSICAKNQSEYIPDHKTRLDLTRHQPLANPPSVDKRVILFSRMHPYKRKKQRHIICCLVNKIENKETTTRWTLAVVFCPI